MVVGPITNHTGFKDEPTPSLESTCSRNSRSSVGVEDGSFEYFCKTGFVFSVYILIDVVEMWSITIETTIAANSRNCL